VIKQALQVSLCVTALAASYPSIGQSIPAQGPRIAFGTGVEQTDNALKTSSRERSETKSYLDLDLGYLRDSEFLRADVQYRGELASYANDTTAEDSVITGSSTIAWKVLPDRMQIDLSHDRSEQIRDSRDPDIRNNRQLRDIVSVGPAFMARLSPVDKIVLNGRYSEVSYESGEATAAPAANQTDSERVSGGLSWQHQLRKTDLLSANYQYSEVKFDEFTEELTYHQIFGTYAVTLRNSGYSISLGLNRSERESAGSDTDGFYAQASWNLRVGTHRFGVIAINQLTDSGVGLGGNALVGGNFRPTDDNFDIVDVVERTSLDIDYGFGGLCDRCDVGLRLGYDEQDFDTQPRDQKQTGFGASFGYRLTPTLKLALRGNYSETEFTQDAGGGREDELQSYGLTLDWMLSRSLSLRAWLTDEERTSDAALQGYEELYGGVSVSYRFR